MLSLLPIEEPMHSKITRDMATSLSGARELRPSPNVGSIVYDETNQVIVRHSSTREDCQIYDLVGPNIHLEAEGILDFTHNNRRP
jgi:hypothetical protein